MKSQTLVIGWGLKGEGEKIRRKINELIKSEKVTRKEYINNDFFAGEGNEDGDKGEEKVVKVNNVTC